MFKVTRKEVTTVETVGYMVLQRNIYSGHWSAFRGFPVRIFNKFHKARQAKYSKNWPLEMYEGIKFIDDYVLHFYYTNLKQAVSQAKAIVSLITDIRCHCIVVRCIIPKNATVYYDDSCNFDYAGTDIANIIDIPIVSYRSWLNDGRRTIDEQ